jgi:hypothetical protein
MDGTEQRIQSTDRQVSVMHVAGKSQMMIRQHSSVKQSAPAQRSNTVALSWHKTKLMISLWILLQGRIDLPSVG